MVLLTALLGSSIAMTLIAFLLISILSFIFPTLGQIMFGIIFIVAGLVLSKMKLDPVLLATKIRGAKITVSLVGILVIFGIGISLLSLMNIPLPRFSASILGPISATPAGSIIDSITGPIADLGLDPLPILTLVAIFGLTVGIFVYSADFFISKKGRNKKK